MKTERSKKRKGLFAIAGLLLAAGTGFAGATQTGLTDAAWNDSEFAKGQVRAMWPKDAFYNLVGMSAQTVGRVDTFVNNVASYDERFRFRQSLNGTNSPKDFSGAGWSWSLGGPVTRNWDSQIRKEGVGVNHGSTEFLRLNDAVSPPNEALLDRSDWEIRNEAADGSSTDRTERKPALNQCGEIYTKPTTSEVCSNSGGKAVVNARNITDSFGFRVKPLAYAAFINVRYMRTEVSCYLDRAEAMAPTGNVDIGEQSSVNGRLDYDKTDRWRNVWSGTGAPAYPSGVLSSFWNAFGPNGDVRVMPISRVITSAEGEQPYALSEAALYVEYWSARAGLRPGLRVAMYFTLSRAECGVQRPTDAQLPEEKDIFLGPESSLSARAMPFMVEEPAPDAATGTESPQPSDTATATETATVDPQPTTESPTVSPEVSREPDPAPTETSTDQVVPTG